jgi:phosphoglycerate kinase
MFNKKTIRDVDFDGKRALVRVDFNVPLKDGTVADDTRIQAALPTINYLLETGASLVLCSHLGRPKGAPDPNLSLRPVATYLDTQVDASVSFAADCVGPLAEQAAAALKSGQILLLENTRFHAGEKKNDPDMAQQLAALGEIFVNDAFGTAHRAHASTVGVAGYLPAVAGLLLEKEIIYLGQVVADPERPFIAVLGGAKVSDKIGVINNLLDKAEQVLIGGGMANTFYKAQGYPVGDSLVEDEALNTARELVAAAGSQLRLPVDLVIGDEFSPEAESRTISAGAVPDGWRIMDIGHVTAGVYGKIVAGARTVVWNGPMGVFEFPRFADGTFALARSVAQCPGTTIVGGGDSAAAIRQSGMADGVTHISTGGGASLEMLEGKTLPGLAVLMDQ